MNNKMFLNDDHYPKEMDIKKPICFNGFISSINNEKGELNDLYKSQTPKF